jgi:hypothetical protein
MTAYQSGRGNYIDETDALVRVHFRLKLAELDEELFRHHVQGIELLVRALFYAYCDEYPGNTEVWFNGDVQRSRVVHWQEGTLSFSMGL